MIGSSAAAFFAHLAARWHKELHLSDVTSAMLQACPEFRQEFVAWFSKDWPRDAALYVGREFVLPDRIGQIDLVFRAGTWMLIVENKLDDEEYHFAQYAELKRRAPAGTTVEYGLLAKREVPKDRDNAEWTMRTWSQFVAHFQNQPYSETALFSGYLHYVREVCGMRHLERFHLDPAALAALHHFTEMILDLLDRAKDEGITRLNDYHNFGPWWAGSYFTLDGHAKAFLGVAFRTTPAFIGVAVEKGDRLYVQAERLTSCSAFAVEDEDHDGVRRWLKMPGPTFDTLNGATTVSEQQQVLAQFFQQCCAVLRAAAVA